MDKERFSLLLLEPNEIYFEDFAVDLKQSVIKSTEEDLTGRLKMCSKSLVFNPKDSKLPLIKLRYIDCENISESVESSEKGTNKSCMLVRCTQYIEMLENNIIQPYTFKKEKRTFTFYFHYVDISDYVLQLCQQLHRASSLHTVEQNTMIAVIGFSRHNRVKFDPLWLENIYEKIIFDCKVDEIRPLVSNPGRLLLTNAYIYFQPYNNIETYPVIKIKLDCINSFIKRRILLRHTGLEIKWINNSSSSSKHIYISFCNVDDRNKFCTLIKQQNDFKLQETEPESMTLKWQNGLISNYEYLLYLNSLADRTFEDLTQYPVFPWIITDYTSDDINLCDPHIYRDLSKPIGALNPERLKKLKERCEEMGESKYLYGSHYSTPGFVLFYLVRKYPDFMLCLQNGRFDHPDRMFNKISDTFHNCLTNMSDFKELIPEFYDTSQKGDFLLNLHKINFGIKCDGTPVNHVTLPPWCKNSPETFVTILREALESDFASANLHNWIDLIFGYKQRGKEAEKADNLFYHMCYEGSVDLDSVKDSSVRHALEVQISEFGQIPKQLFTNPHPLRKFRQGTINNPSVRSPISSESHMKFSKMDLQSSYIAHKDEITSLSLDGDVILSTGKDGVLKYFSVSQPRQISASLGDSPLSSCFKIPNSNIFIIGSWDNTILVYDFNYGKISDIIPAHDDAVSCMNLIEDLEIFISGSWDCSVKIWKGFRHDGYFSFRLSNSMIAHVSLDDRVSSLTNKQFENTLQIVIGTECGDVIICDFNIPILQNTIHYDEPEQRIFLKHSSEITGMEFNKSGGKLATCSADGLLIVTDTTTGMTLFQKSLDHSPRCLTWCGEIDYLLTGDDNGYLSVWDLLQGDLNFYKEICKGPLSCVKYSCEHEIIVTAGKDESCYKIKCWIIK